MKIHGLIQKIKYHHAGFLFKICILFLALIQIQSKAHLTAQTKINLSATMNYELINGYFPGYDLTLLINKSWGIRMTSLPDFIFLETGKPITNTSSVIINEIQGDLNFAMALKLIDYLSYQNNASIPFDYLTAYIGMGYNRVNPKLTQRKFFIQNSIINEQRNYETVEIPVTALSFGFYGGQSFLVIDGRIMYLKGKTEDSQFLESKYELDQWLFLLSIGIGF